MRHADDNIRYIQLIPSRVKVHSDVVVTHTHTLAFRMALFQSITTSRPQPKGPTYHFNSFLSLTLCHNNHYHQHHGLGNPFFQRSECVRSDTYSKHDVHSFCSPATSTSHSRLSSLVVTANNRPYLHRRHLETRTRPRGLV